MHACHFVLNIVQRYSGIFCISQAKHLNIILNIKTLFSYDRAHKENIYTLWNATPWSSFFFKTLGFQFFYLNFPLKNYDKFRLHVLKNKSQFCGKYFNNFFLQKQYIYKLITFPKKIFFVNHTKFIPFFIKLSLSKPLISFSLS